MPMAAPKGTKPPGGSRKGIPNKATADIKAMILGALDAQQGGGKAYLQRQAIENPVAFMGLVGKLLPKDVIVDQTTNVIINRERIDDANASLRAALDRVQRAAQDAAAGAGVVH